jgi:DivIVA domain-containing protein
MPEEVDMAGNPLRAEDVSSARFTRALNGYAAAPVQTLLARSAEELDRRAGGRTPLLTAAELRGADLPRALRGYAMSEVDDLLDRLADQLEGPGPLRLPEGAAFHPSRHPGGHPAGRAPNLRERSLTVALRGYAMSEVDRLLDRAADELDRLRGGAGDAPRITAADVRRAEFTKALRGYAVAEVNALLDRTAAELDALTTP